MESRDSNWLVQIKHSHIRKNKRTTFTTTLAVIVKKIVTTIDNNKNRTI